MRLNFKFSFEFSLIWTLYVTVFILNQNFIAVYSLYKNIKAVVLGVLYFVFHSGLDTNYVKYSISLIFSRLPTIQTRSPNWKVVSLSKVISSSFRSIATTMLSCFSPK